MFEILLVIIVILIIALFIALFLLRKANAKKIEAIKEREIEVMQRTSCESTNKVLQKQANITAKHVPVEDAYQGLKDD